MREGSEPGVNGSSVPVVTLSDTESKKPNTAQFAQVEMGSNEGDESNGRAGPQHDPYVPQPVVYHQPPPQPQVRTQSVPIPIQHSNQGKTMKMNMSARGHRICLKIEVTMK